MKEAIDIGIAQASNLRIGQHTAKAFAYRTKHEKACG